MTTSEVAAAGTEKQGLLQRLVKGLADIFVPIIPAIVAGGLLMGIHSMLTAKVSSLKKKCCRSVSRNS